MITQAEIETVWRLREHARITVARATELQMALLCRLQNGEPIEAGPLTAEHLQEQAQAVAA